MPHRRLPLRLAAAAGAGLVLFGGAAFAHPGHEEATLMTAFAHPWSGWDHMLAMIAVGFAAVTRSRGGAPFLAAPLAFMGAMTVGALSAWAGLPVGWAEFGILASIAAALALIVAAGRLPAVAVVAIAALAGLPHGAAHGAELAGGASALAGFLASTALLHGLGLMAGLAAPALARTRIK